MAATTTEDVPMTDPTTDNDIQDKKKAAGQIDFYFTDANLPYDRFMWSLHTATPEHWVDLSTISGFKRMRGWKAKGDEWLLDALRQFGEMVEVADEGGKIRRKGEVRENAGFERSVYAKGFPDETPELQVELEKFFSQYGRVNMVRMRRDKDKKFKNSVFCEFSTDEAMQAFLALDPKPKWNDQELKIMSKKDYCDEKIKEKNIPADKVHHWSQVRAGHTGFNAFREMDGKSKGPRGKGATGVPTVPEDVFMEFMGKQVQVFDKDPNVAEGEESAEAPAPAANNGRGGGRGKKAKEVKQAFVKKEGFPYVLGASLRFTLSEGVVMLPFGAIKEPLKETMPGTRPYIAYERGKTSGILGFDNPLTEEEVEKIKETIPKLVEKDVTWEKVGEEEEKEYQFKRALEIAQKTLNPDTKPGKGDARGGGGGGRGGRGGGGRNARSSGGDASASTAAAENGSRGEKRKRPVEPEGGLGSGERNVGIPTISTGSSGGNPSKKQKTDEV